MTDRDRLRAQIEEAARTFEIAPDLLASVVLVESGGDPYAWNPEPTYRYLWDVRKHRPFRTTTSNEVRAKFPPKDFSCLAGDPDQEWWGQQASWGLCQIMGAVAREYGFAGSYLPGVCDPDANLVLGAGILSSLSRWAHGDLAKMLAAYNAGRGGWASIAGQNYARKVLKQIDILARARVT